MNAPHRILFVCHGNICRSTMAEFVMKDLVVVRNGKQATVGYAPDVWKTWE